MIKDSIKNYLTYNLDENLNAGLKYLAQTDFSSMENGKYEILKDKVFAIVQDYNTKHENIAKFEAHRKYIDIQYIIKGQEKIGVAQIEGYTAIGDYDEEKDIIFFNGKATDFITMKEGDFAIFFPQDLHMPSVAINESSYVKKVVVKSIV